MPLTSLWPVETGRLRLRPLTEGDVEALAAYRSLPEVARYIPHEPMDGSEIRRRLTTGAWRAQPLVQDGDGLVIGVARREDDRVIGDLYLGLTRLADRGAEIGWVLHPDFGGHGYATEAAAALLTIAFGTWGLHRVVARVDARNGASLALARRLGMRQEAHLIANEWFKGGWSDEIDFALLQDEWCDRPASAR